MTSPASTLSRILALALLLGVLAPAPGLAEVLQHPVPMTTALRQAAMPEMDDSRVGRILARYYQQFLGGEATWRGLESIKYDGSLKVDGTVFALSAFQKKPNLIKMTLIHPVNQGSLQLGYDGQTAWKQGAGQPAETMTPEEARRFIHGVRLGGHLIHPFAEGKTIRYIDTVPIEGSICHQLRVELETSYEVDYFIDIRSLAEVKVINRDLKNDFTNSIVYHDYQRVGGIPVPVLVDNYENGELVSRLDNEEIRINSGVMPWMFRLPASPAP